MSSLTTLAVSAFACQVVLDIDSYEFSQVQEERQPAQGVDSGSEPDVGADSGLISHSVHSVDGGRDAGRASLDDAAVPPVVVVPPPCSGDGCDSCQGCRVDGLCVLVGEPLPANPCLLCDPTAASGYSIAVGRACGAEETVCSNQDRCDAAGSCAPRHRTAGTPCGDGKGTACDGVDVCDGAGTCIDGRAGEGTPCEDGSFCTSGDRCQTGECVAGGPLACGANEQCSEDADACVCPGCVVGGSCVPAGTRSGPCLVCDPARSTTALSADVGAVCAGSDGVCFDTRACNASGECASRPLSPGVPCGDQSSSACTGPDSCDGSGNCGANDALDGTACEDGFLCTRDDSCQGGGCASGSELICDNFRSCNEQTGCDCPLGLQECFDGTCRNFCDFLSQ